MRSLPVLIPLYSTSVRGIHSNTCRKPVSNFIGRIYIKRSTKVFGRVSPVISLILEVGLGKQTDCSGRDIKTVIKEYHTRRVKKHNLGTVNYRNSGMAHG